MASNDKESEEFGARRKIRRHSGDNTEEKFEYKGKKRNYSGDCTYDGNYPNIEPLHTALHKESTEKKLNEESLSEIISLCKMFNQSINTLTKENKTRDEKLNNAFGQQQQQLYNITEQMKAHQGRTQYMEQEILQIRRNNVENQINSTIPILGRTTINSQENKQLPSTMDMKMGRSKLNDALKLIKTFEGADTSNWINHRKKLENVIWMFELEQADAIKMIKLSFGADALQLSDNINVDRYLQNNMSENPIKDYLDEIETLFIETFHGKEMTRIKFFKAKQNDEEPITLWATRLKNLFKLAHPDAKDFENDYRITDRFIDGLNSQAMKKFVLEQKENEDSLSKLLKYCLKHESVKIRCGTDTKIDEKITKTAKGTNETTEHINTIQYQSNGKIAGYKAKSPERTVHWEPRVQYYERNKNIHNSRRNDMNFQYQNRMNMGYKRPREQNNQLHFRNIRNYRFREDFPRRSYSNDRRFEQDTKYRRKNEQNERFYKDNREGKNSMNKRGTFKIRKRWNSYD